MKKNNRIKTSAFLLLCLPFCGGWTVAAEQQQQDDRYVGGELLSTYANGETISYISKEVVDVYTDNKVPVYTATGNMQNGCGAVAGSIIVGFYDKYYPNLIPNWESYYSIGLYKPQDATYVPALMQDLYVRMKTNVVDVGVSESEFKTGLTSYVNNQGYNLQYVSLGSGNSFNYTAFQTAVKNNEVTVLFVQPSNLYSFALATNQDIISTTAISGNHIMVAYGYYEVTYKLTNGTRTDIYLRVSTGISVSLLFYKVGSYIDSAYEVKIS